MMMIVNVLAVEVTVAVTGGAFQRVERTFLSGCQELAATVQRVASHTQRVVLQAFSVSGYRRGGGRRSGGVVVVGTHQYFGLTTG